MIYLASPYSDSSTLRRQHRYNLVAELYAKLLTTSDEAIFCPIASFHHLAQEYKLPTSAEFWWPVNRSILRHASALWIARIEGYAQSTGIAQELEFALACGIPVRYLSPAGDFVK
jgi:hypothetical protein